MAQQPYQTLERKARLFATRAHQGQVREGKSHLPYITHPAAVVRMLKKAGITDQDILSAAWLHDVMEDCGIQYGTILGQFNEHIADMVQVLTRVKGFDDRLDYLIRIQKASPEVQLIKIADVLHNIRTLEKGFSREKWDRKYYATKWVYYPITRKLCSEEVVDLDWAVRLDLNIQYMEHYLNCLDKEKKTDA